MGVGGWGGVLFVENHTYFQLTHPLADFLLNFDQVLLFHMTQLLPLYVGFHNVI